MRWILALLLGVSQHGPRDQLELSAITPLKRRGKQSWQEFPWEQKVGVCQEF